MMSTSGVMIRSGRYDPSKPSPTTMCSRSGPATNINMMVGKAKRKMASKAVVIFSQNSSFLPSANRFETRGYRMLVNDRSTAIRRLCSLYAVVK